MLKFLFQQSLFSNLITVLVLVLGVITVLSLPKEDFPPIDFDVVSVTTLFPGSTPEQVERLVTNPIEDEVRTVFGIKDLFSTSSEGLSTVVVVIDPDYPDKDEAVTEIQRAVDRVTGLPEVIDRPLVQEFKTAREPSIVLALSEKGEITQDYKPSLELREMAKKLQREIETHPLVAEVRIDGKEDLEYLIEIPSKKLRDLGLSVDEVTGAFLSQNLSVAGGESEQTSGSVRYRIDNELTTTEKIENVILRSTIDGQVFRVGDLGTVTLGQKKSIYYNRSNGRPAMILNVVRKAKTDVLDVTDEVKVLAENFVEQRNQIEDRWQVGYASDLADIVRVRLGSLTSSVIIGGIFVVIMLLLALNLSTALIVAIGIPFSFLGAVILMPPLGLSINLLTMFGFVVVLGMLVDDAIVVSESIFSELEDGKDRLTATVEGTRKVIVPVVGSVMTSVLAFAPLVFMSGIFGKFVKFIPIIVILCLLVSLIEAFFVLPNHMRDFYREKKKKTNERHPFEKIRDAYRAIVTWCVKRRYLVTGASFLFVILSVASYVAFGKYDNFPDEGIESFYITLQGESDLSQDDMAKRLLPLEKKILEIPSNYIDAAISYIGQTQLGGAETRRQGTNYAQITVFLSAEASQSIEIDELIDQLRPDVEAIPNIQERQIKKLAGGPPEGAPVTVFFRGDDLEVLRQVVEEAKKVLEQTDGVNSISDSDSPGKLEAVYSLNFQKALQAGVNPKTAGLAVQMAVDGAFLGEVKSEVETTRLRLQVPKSETPEKALQNLTATTSTGERIPVVNLLDIKKKEPGLYAVQHYNAQRAIVLSAEVDDSKITGLEANAALAKHYPEWLAKYPGVNIVPLGANRDTTESFDSLKQTAVLALLGVAFVMILTMGSLWQPLVVFSSVPLGFAGIIIVFFVHGKPLSFLALFGIVGLVGVAVNVGIVLMDRINTLSKQMPYREALIEGSVARLRAVLLTSATTVLGLMPTAYGWGGGDEFLKPMALALGWGIAFSTILGILTIPVYLAVIEDFRLWAVRMCVKFGLKKSVLKEVHQKAGEA